MLDRNPFVLSASGTAALLLSVAPFIPASEGGVLVLDGFLLTLAFLFRHCTWKHAAPHPDEHWFAHIPEKQGVFFGDLVTADDYFVSGVGAAEKKTSFFDPSNLKNIGTLFGFLSAVIFLIARNQEVVFSKPVFILSVFYGLVIIWTGRSRGLQSILFLSIFVNFCYWIGFGMVRPILEVLWIFVLIFGFYAQKILVYDSFRRDFYKLVVGTPAEKSRAFWRQALGAAVMYTLGLIAMYQGLESLYQHLPNESPKRAVDASIPSMNSAVKSAAKFLAQFQRGGASLSTSGLGGSAIRQAGRAPIGSLPLDGVAKTAGLPLAGGAGTGAVSHAGAAGTSASSQNGGAGLGALPRSGSAELGGLPQAGGSAELGGLPQTGGSAELGAIPHDRSEGTDVIPQIHGVEISEIPRSDRAGVGATDKSNEITLGEIPEANSAATGAVPKEGGASFQGSEAAATGASFHPETNAVDEKKSADTQELNARKSLAVQKPEELERQWRMRLEILLSVLKLVALLLIGYFLYRFLLRRRQIRKEIAHQPSAPQLSNEAKSKFRNIFRYLYQQKLGAKEEVLATYYGLEKLFEEAHCGRPPSLPTTHYSAELNQSAPRIGGPFLPIASLFCDTFYGGAKPDAGAITDLRKSVQDILRELGIHCSTPPAIQKLKNRNPCRPH